MVAARETTLQELLEGSKQYQVPLYQRTYSWSRDQLARLWEDIITLAEDRILQPKLTHFIGSLVLAPSPSNGPTGVQEFLVVDGQQRLTTLSILLCAIRDHRAATEGSAEHIERVNEQYLINRWKSESVRLKVVPTQADRASYLACLDSTPNAGGSDPVGSAYRYFSEQLVKHDDPDDDADIERIEDAVISGLALVSVTAQPGDNAHRIFESLNNTGLKLTQGDLLRNYLFMRLPTRGESVYQSTWLPLQSELSSSELELLFWLDLVQRDARVKQTETYSGQQARLDRLTTEEQIENEIVRFARMGSLLKIILEPARETNPNVRLRLERLNAWGTTTVYPLLLNLLERRADNKATSDEIASAMLTVESFFVRRLLIGRATNNLNRIMLSAVTEMTNDVSVDEALRRYLSTGRKHFGTDADIRNAVGSFPFYLNGRAAQRSLILRWLEQSHASKEPVNLQTLTIEHVMPQTLTPEWEQVLKAGIEPDENVEEVHQALLHTLGNLTLTGYNSELSNSPFDVKRTFLSTSGVLMNQAIANAENWGPAEIRARGAELAERIISIWPGPSDAESSTQSGVPWDVMNAALAALPPGSWTTYGDLAALIGSHAVPVGMRLANHPAPNAHRVLQIEGTVSPGFKWLDASRSDDPAMLLRTEGVEFDEHGRAKQSQRMTTEELAQLIGITDEELPAPIQDLGPGQDAALRDRFMEQLSAYQSPTIVHSVLAVLKEWEAFGGRLEYGEAAETSCFLLARAASNERGSIWPLTIYPSGKCEVVFQHLATRSPFDDPQMREEFRVRLNSVPAVDIPATKIELRPGFNLSVIADMEARQSLVEQLAWFASRTMPAEKR